MHAGYPHRPHLQCNWNKAMSLVRVSVEWIYGDIANYFKFLDFKKNLKVNLSAVGKRYIVLNTLSNRLIYTLVKIAHTILKLHSETHEDAFV